MGGLEEILKQIEKESNEEMADILSEAEDECNKIKVDNIKEISELVDKKNRQAEETAQLMFEKIKSSAMTRQKQEILKTKQRVIYEILEKTNNVLINIEEEQYFKILIKIAENNAHNENGAIYFNDKDLKRIPDNFVERLRAKGIRVKIADKPVEISGGMIIEYGNVQENCTFKALINSKKEILQDTINKYLFNS